MQRAHNAELSADIQNNNVMVPDAKIDRINELFNQMADAVEEANDGRWNMEQYAEIYNSLLVAENVINGRPKDYIDDGQEG